MNRKALLMVLTLAIAIVASACSSPSPTVTITTPPPASLEINQSATIAATTTHDKDEGVTWSCSPSPCGSFNPTVTLTGVTTVYTAPSTAGAVTITATSNKKVTVTATASVTITPVATAASLTGQYGFYFSGFDAAGFFYAAAGSVTLDGAGNVTAGEEDLNDANFGAPVLGDLLTGTYTVNNDGQGTMVLTATTGAPPVADPLVGVGGMQTLAFTVVNSNHAMVTEFDAANTSGGSLDFQTPSAITAGFTGNYAFTGAGFLSGTPEVFGGVVNTATLTGTADQNVGGSITTGVPTAWTISATDANGRGTFTVGGIDGTFYVIGPEAIRFVETDTGIPVSGSFLGQPSTPNFNAGSLSGVLVIDQPWPASFAVSVSGPAALAGQFTADGVSAFTGVVDYNDAGLIPPGPGPDALAASYAVATDGYGSITAGVVTNDPDFTTWGLYLTDPALNLIDPNNTSGGGGALIAELDVNDLGAGFLTPQSATALSGVNNETDLAAFNSNGDYINAVGQVVASPTGSVGTASVNDINPFVAPPTSTQTPGETLDGVTTADTTNVGRYTFSLTVNGATTPLSQVVYVAGGGLAVVVDIDSVVGPPAFAQVGSGTVQGQQ
jgi:hypothetical protein